MAKAMNILNLPLLLFALIWVSPANGSLYLFGDSTPIFSTALVSNFEIVRGNQTLFLRLVGSSDKTNRRVVVHSRSEFFDLASHDLEELYRSNSIGFDRIDDVSSSALYGADLLIVGFSNWDWKEEEVAAVRALLARNKNVVLVTEPLVCKHTCLKSTEQILKSLGSRLRLGPRSQKRGEWALLADHELMRGIGAVKYGLTFTVTGGMPLMYQADGLSMLSVDEELVVSTN